MCFHPAPHGNNKLYTVNLKSIHIKRQRKNTQINVKRVVKEIFCNNCILQETAQVHMKLDDLQYRCHEIRNARKLLKHVKIVFYT